LGLIRRFVGTPYLWGGRSPYGYDCSGLAQTFYGFMGVAIPRDADLQCRDGMEVAGEPEPGDLLFFGKAGVGLAGVRYAHVTHVTISLGGADFMHASGSSVGITTNSFDPHSSIYNAYLKEFSGGEEVPMKLSWEPVTLNWDDVSHCPTGRATSVTT
jgi:cell wall-associated NlpC family hydrolase